MYRVSILVLSLALALGACSKKSSTTPTAPDPVTTTEPTTPADAADPAKPAAPSDAELNAMFEQTLTFLADIGTAIETNASDCQAMGSALDAVMTKHHDLLAKTKEFGDNDDINNKADEFMKAHEDEVMAAQNKLAGLQACQGDPGVQKAMARFDEP
jgi:hypothetical protein